MGKSKQTKRSKSGSNHSPISGKPKNSAVESAAADPTLPGLLSSLRSTNKPQRDAALSALSTLFQTTHYSTANRLFQPASLSAIAVCSLDSDATCRLHSVGAILNFLIKNRAKAAADDNVNMAISQTLRQADVCTPVCAAVAKAIQGYATRPADGTGPFLPLALRALAEVFETFAPTVPLTASSSLVPTLFAFIDAALRKLPAGLSADELTALTTALRITHTYSESSALPPAILSNLRTILSVPGLPSAPLLHTVGALLSDSPTPAFITSLLPALSALPPTLLSPLPPSFQALTASAADFANELRDAATEEAAVANMGEETAKELAKKLKAEKAAKESAASEGAAAGSDAAMDVAEEESAAEPEAAGVDRRAVHEANLMAWSEHVLVVNLFCEIVTNMAIAANGGEDAGEAAVEWDSDGEDEMNRMAAEGPSSKRSAGEGVDALAQNGGALLSSIVGVVSSLSKAEETIFATVAPPKSVVEEVGTMLDRAYSALLALLQIAPAIVASNPAAGAALFGAIIANRNLVAGASMLQTLKALLTADPKLVALVSDDVLRFVMAAATMQTSSEAECRQAAVSVLASLCAGVHTEAIDRVVCDFLLNTLRNDSSVMVADEVLNGLMDVYGADNCFRNVYDDLRVSVVIQEQLQLFKRRGKEAGGEEEQMQVKETALNVKRFVKYMVSGK
jgi:hypothetical protein